MQGSTPSKPKSGPGADGKTAGFPFIPRPRTLGRFAVLVTALAFTAGWLRNELALTLLGTVFLAVLSYSFLGVFFLGLLYRGKVRTLSMTLTSETVNTGKEGELRVKINGGKPARKNRFPGLPAILKRCELFLETKDGRVIRHYAFPGAEEYSRFPVKERGAFFPVLRSGGGFVIFDAPGFFRLSFPVETGGLKLLALPAPAPELINIPLNSGGTEERNEPHYRKSDELTNHRPYIPGDDPRRINWKLYGHAPLGELFVREGENEPPPHSRLLILIDTGADSALYTLEEAREAVDLLCENALTFALELSARGMDILIGHTGGGITGRTEGNAPAQDPRESSRSGGPLNAGELAAALARPAALLWRPEPKRKSGAAAKRLKAPAEENDENLPQAPGDRGVLILALPRASAGVSALDRFLKNRESADRGAGADIVFLYHAEDKRAALLEESAKLCVSFYNRKPGVHAGIIRAGRGTNGERYQKIDGFRGGR